jgi:hypothetical protein
MRVIGRLGLGLLCLLFGAWGGAALWFDGPAWRPLAGALGGAFFLAVLGLPQRSRRGGVVAAMLSAVLLAWWLAIPPRNDRNWQPDVSRSTANSNACGTSGNEMRNAPPSLPGSPSTGRDHHRSTPSLVVSACITASRSASMSNCMRIAYSPMVVLLVYCFSHG